MYQFNYFMPTKIFFGRGQVKMHPEIFASAGKKALIVTGRQSAKINGSYNDVIETLQQAGVASVLFDEVEENPSLETIEAGARIGLVHHVDFVVGIGGGSPMDAAKAMAVFIKNPQINQGTIFQSEKLDHVPVIAIATTSGTGSEVTPYSIVTSKADRTKKNLGQSVFPIAAFLDSHYTDALPYHITVHTAIDAFTHLVEGYLNTNATRFSDQLAEDGFRLFGNCFRSLCSKNLNFEFRDTVMYTSMIAGVVIAQTGTSLPHGMGYALTYHKGLAHGVANGILTIEYLKIFKNFSKIESMLNLLGYQTLSELEDVFKVLMPDVVQISEEEIKEFSEAIMSNQAKIKNHPETVTLDQIITIYKKSLL